MGGVTSIAEARCRMQKIGITRGGRGTSNIDYASTKKLIDRKKSPGERLFRERNGDGDILKRERGGNPKKEKV